MKTNRSHLSFPHEQQASILFTLFRTGKSLMEIGCLGSGDGNIIATRLEPDPIRIESSRGAL